MLLSILIVLFYAASVLARAVVVYKVTDFGAVGNGKILDTKAIQSAVDACSENGGGTVYFPAGTYLSGKIYLKNQVRLNLEVGAVLLGSTRVDDYPLNKCEFPSYSDSYVGRALIWGEGLHDVAITGRGTIDGQGAQFRNNRPSPEEWKRILAFYDDTTRYQPQQRYINRPYGVRLISCRNILIEGITMRNSAMWMQQYLNCDFVRIQNIKVYNHGSYNNDMIDIDCSRNVVISGCFGDSGDDALTLKSTGGVATENVVISNCILSSFCNAIKMGTESSGGFKNITITNCVIQPSSESNLISGRRQGLSGIALEMVDGGTLDGITISNIVIKGTTAPIFMRLGNRARTYKLDQPIPPVGKFRNIVVSNIIATEASMTGCSITGIPGHPIENVTLSNIKIKFVGGGAKELSDKEVPENEKKYPESTMFGILPAYGFFCRHVDGITFREVTISYEAPDHRPALICDDVRNLKLDNFTAQVAPDALSQIIFRNTRDVLISSCQPPESEVFLRLEKQCQPINIIGNDLSRTKTPFVFAASVKKSVLYAESNRMGNGEVMQKEIK